MSWEEQVFALFDDLEQQASSLFAQEREAELRDRARSEYAQVSLVSRLMASVDREVALEVRGVGRVAGRAVGASDGQGAAWCLLRSGATDWVVLVDAVQVAHGTSPRSVPDVARGPGQRLGLGAVLRRLGDAATPVTAHLRDGSRVEGELARVGRDFSEVVTAAGATLLVAHGALAALSSREG